jgi:hypothetical protein
MTGRICRVRLLLSLASAVILGSEYNGTHDHILLSVLILPNLEGQVPVFISPRNTVAQLRYWAESNIFPGKDPAENTSPVLPLLEVSFGNK